jgi:flavin reductase (DIM6/NTAB) family NADH-FMN oxidoreductase RutF/DNA-binding IclR family transcriptional regulator
MSYLESFDQRQLRNVFGTFPTGVTVVTTSDRDGRPCGVTANSFSSVSLDPPLVLWSQAVSSKSFAAFNESDCFAVNILAEEQVAISNQFAKSGVDKFAGVPYSEGLEALPVIEGVAAHLECRKVATYPGGDHVVYIGKVERIGYSHRRPLAFSSGRYMIPFAHELGPINLQLGSFKQVPPEALRQAIASMSSIAENVGSHSLCLGVWGNHGPTTIYWEPSSHPISEIFPVGLVLSVTSSAMGRVFVAYLPEEATKVFVEEDLRLLRKADVDPVEQRRNFDVEIESVRKHGLAYVGMAEASVRVHKIPTSAFVAPIFDSAGAVIMVMTMMSHVDRLGEDHTTAGPQTLLRECRKISVALGCCDPKLVGEPGALDEL